MKTVIKNTLLALFVCMMSAGNVSAQNWVVIELSGSINDFAEIVKEQYGEHPDSLLSHGFDASYVKFTGQDYRHDDWLDYTVSMVMARFFKKTKVMDFSEIAPNAYESDPANGYYFYYDQVQMGYNGPDAFVDKLMEFPALDSLQKIILPTSLVYTNATVNGSKNIKEVVLPEGMKGLASGMFSSMRKLETVNIPSQVKKIPYSCFSGCESLQHIDLPEGIETVEQAGFGYCSSLKSVGNTKLVRQWGDDAFARCYALESIELCDTLSVIPYGMFEKCENLKEITLPKTLKKISDSAFDHCTSLKSFTLPEGLKHIGTCTFQSVPIEHIDLPESLEYLGGAFSDTPLKSIVIPDNVTCIDGGCFSGCADLESIKLSANITEIGYQLFWGCEKLRNITIPAKVTSVAYEAFRRCYSLDTVTVLGPLKFIDTQAFYESGVRHINLPNTLKEIKSNAFAASALEEIDIPGSVTKLSTAVFNECRRLKRVTFAEGLQEIHDHCFASCDSLQEAILPSTVRLLGNNVFEKDTTLRKLVVSPLVTDISPNLCSECKNLEEIVLGDNVFLIGQYAFYHCYKLRHVDFPKNLSIVGQEAFNGCPLDEIKLPSTIRDIYMAGFGNNRAKEIILPEGLEYIGNNAFYSETVEVIDIPSSVVRIGSYILGDQKALKTIYCRRLNETLSMYGGGDVTIYLPAKSIERFRYDFEYYHKWTVLPLEEAVKTVTVTEEQSTASGYFYTQDGANLNVSSTYQYGAYASYQKVGQLYVDENTDWAVNNLHLDYIENGYGTYKLSPSIVADGTLTANSMSVRLVPNYVNGWHFLTAPFDMKVSDITPSLQRVPYVVRVYDSAQRSVANHDKVWKKPADDEIIKAGQGFILNYEYETRPNGEYTRYFIDNLYFTIKSATPHNGLAVLNTNAEVPLYNGEADYPHNKGWNLVGNPFFAYYDFRFIDNDAPILLSTGTSSEPYTAYSPIDDELILKPLQGFFVQAKEKQEKLVFKPEGRQKDLSVRTIDTGLSPRYARRKELRQNRLRYDIMLSTADAAGEDSLLCRTRLVRTPRATSGYDLGQDAMFMTMDENATAVYTRVNGLRYSLNEQPLSTHAVPLGLRLKEARTYTLQLKTNDESGDRIFLYDRNTDKEVDITEPYTFTIDAPTTLNHRFEIRIGDGINGIEDLFETNDANASENGIFDLQGRRMNKLQGKGIYIENGKKYIK